MVHWEILGFANRSIIAWEYPKRTKNLMLQGWDLVSCPKSTELLTVLHLLYICSRWKLFGKAFQTNSERSLPHWKFHFCLRQKIWPKTPMFTFWLGWDEISKLWYVDNVDMCHIVGNNAVFSQLYSIKLEIVVLKKNRSLIFFYPFHFSFLFITQFVPGHIATFII